jgi:hypothetical protein
VKFKKSDKIEFVSTIEGLESIEECLPRPAKHFIPKWFKDIPSSQVGTVKSCPSFPDYFSQGYVLPMWTDVKLNIKGDRWSWKTPLDMITWDVHNNDQFLDHVSASFNGSDSQFVFKANCPWRIITPPGWSVLQLPLFYHFNKDFSVLPGVIDTDIHNEINQQVLYHGNEEEVKINLGDPFALYIPFKRSNNIKHEVRYRSEEEKKDFDRKDLDLVLSFKPTGRYRKRQRDRDKNF